MPITWNVTNNWGSVSDRVTEKLQAKKDKLDVFFSPPHEEAAHLEVVLESNTHKNFRCVALHLQTPHRGFHACKKAKGQIASLDAAFGALFRQVTEWRAKVTDARQQGAQ